MSWLTLMPYFVLSAIGEESLNQLLSVDPGADPDHPKGGLSHGYNIYCVKKSSHSEQ